MGRDLLKLLILLSPAIPVALVYFLYTKHRRNNWIEAVGLSLHVNGFFWAPVTFLALVWLGMSGKMKFHDWAGVGYMVLLIIAPLAVFLVFNLAGSVLTWIGGMFRSSVEQSSLALSPEALAILHGLAQLPQLPPPLPTQASWRDYARHASRDA